MRACRKCTPQILKTLYRLLEAEQWSPEQIVGYCGREGIPMMSRSWIYISTCIGIRSKGASFIGIRATP